MKYILTLLITLLISGSVYAAQSASTATSGSAQANAIVNGTAISSFSQNNQVDADTFATAGGKATAQSSNGISTTTSVSNGNADNISIYPTTAVVNKPLPIETKKTDDSKTAKFDVRKIVKSEEKKEEVKPTEFVSKLEDKKIKIAQAEKKTEEAIENLNKRLKILNQLVGSAIVILVIILLNQLVLTYLLLKQYRKDITLQV